MNCECVELDLKTLRNGDLVEFKNGERYLVHSFANFKNNLATRIYFKHHAEMYFNNGRSNFYCRDWDIIKIIRID